MRAAGPNGLPEDGAVVPRPALELRRDVPAAAWDDFVVRHPDATVYHLAAWTDLIQDLYGHRV